VPTTKDKSLESWIWDAACSIRGPKDAPKFKDTILQHIFTKRFWDEELKKNDYNISPSRYINTGDAETYRPIVEIVTKVNELMALCATLRVVITASQEEWRKHLESLLNKAFIPA